MAEGAVRDILLINVSRIGDTLLVTPAMRAIAARFPGARITCLAHPKRMAILQNLPFLHRVGAITKQRARFMGRIGRKGYDLAFVYGNDRPLIAYALRVAHKVIAYRQGDPRIDARLHKAVEPELPQSMHSVLLHLALPGALNIPSVGFALSYHVTEAEVLWAGETLRRHLPPQAGPLIGLQVASFPTKAYRDWPIENFLALCERIVRHHPRAHFLIFGGALERQRTDTLHRCLAANSTLFAGTLSLRQSAALMKGLDLYIGVDTGPTHIMGALGMPMVVLYHCYSPSRLFAPLEHPCLYVVDHPRSAAERSPQVPMAEIDVDSVWEKVAAALVAHPSRAARADSLIQSPLC